MQNRKTQTNYIILINIVNGCLFGDIVRGHIWHIICQISNLSWLLGLILIMISRSKLLVSTMILPISSFAEQARLGSILPSYWIDCFPKKWRFNFRQPGSVYNTEGKPITCRALHRPASDLLRAHICIKFVRYKSKFVTASEYSIWDM